MYVCKRIAAQTILYFLLCLTGVALSLLKVSVLSGIECKDEVFAAHQVQHVDLKPVLVQPSPVATPAAAIAPIEVTNGAVVTATPPEEERPIPVTELIFAPRKKEMNKGFLMFSPDEGLTSKSRTMQSNYLMLDFSREINIMNIVTVSVLKDEPEDLTHLAPTAGDTCIPLENSPFDMFDEFMLNDNYCSLLGDDLTNGSPVDSLTPESLLLSSPEPHVRIMQFSFACLSLY